MPTAVYKERTKVLLWACWDMNEGCAGDWKRSEGEQGKLARHVSVRRWGIYENLHYRQDWWPG